MALFDWLDRAEPGTVTVLVILIFIAIVLIDSRYKRRP